MPLSATVKVSLLFVGLGLVCLLFADLAVISLNPWHELGRLALGFLTPARMGVGIAHRYRWEIILRETAILGILGIATVGFYIDSAIQSIRMDRALFLILITALLNIGVDAMSRLIRARLRLTTTPECER